MSDMPKELIASVKKACDDHQTLEPCDYPHCGCEKLPRGTEIAAWDDSAEADAKWHEEQARGEQALAERCNVTWDLYDSLAHLYAVGEHTDSAAAARARKVPATPEDSPK